jgi:hypothetical protein
MDFINIGDNNFCAFRFGRKYKLCQPEQCLFPSSDKTLFYPFSC